MGENVMNTAATAAEEVVPTIEIAAHAGTCYGVQRALDMALAAAPQAEESAQVHTLGPLIHNPIVVRELAEAGVGLAETLDDAATGTVIIRAHGVVPQVIDAARKRGLNVVDATCPYVKKVHMAAERLVREGYRVVVVGEPGHPEVEGTMGQVDGGIELVENTADVAALPYTNDDSLAYVTQTTISADDSQAVIDALRHRFPFIQEPKRQDICYATTNRQEAVKLLARSGVDIVLVIGSATSSNSNRLREVAEREGARAYLIDTAEHIDPKWFEGVACVGITAGASAPESLVQGVLRYLEANLNAEHAVALEGVEENVVFPLPKGLREEDAD